jgi:hypothetical protein
MLIVLCGETVHGLLFESKQFTFVWKTQNTAFAFIGDRPIVLQEKQTVLVAADGQSGRDF